MAPNGAMFVLYIKIQLLRKKFIDSWSRGQDSNLRPLGYEPNELPDCSTPHQRGRSIGLPICLVKKIGAEERIRTSTSYAHYPLKVACLPVPPLRHLFL